MTLARSPCTEDRNYTCGRPLLVEAHDLSVAPHTLMRSANRDDMDLVSILRNCTD